MTSYEIQVDLHGDDKWQTSATTTSRGWQKALANHKAAYSHSSFRAVKIKTAIELLRVLKMVK